MVDFLGIGAQKAGTTWLFRNLERHPQARFPAGKEVHFWDERRDQGVQWWLGLFADTSKGVRQGEITPAYATLPVAAIAEIARHCPDVRLFYCLRNPVERAWSAALMALERAEMTLEEASDQWLLDHFRSRGSLSRGDYAGCLERWWSVFGREPLLVLCLDELRADPRGSLKRLARHLDVDEAFFDTLPENELTSPEFAGPGAPIRPSLAPALASLYAERIHALETLIERDLSHWRSPAGSEARG